MVQNTLSHKMGMSAEGEVVVGVLALQGAFAEHETMLLDLRNVKGKRVVPVQVREPNDLARCDALIIPGGESTTIALLIRLSSLHEPIHDFLRSKPVWGTCAGAILLSRSVIGAKKGGQELLGALDVDIERNGFGSQLESFEAPLQLETGSNKDQTPFNGVFIRAPVVLSAKAKPNSPPIQVISRIPPSHLPDSPIHDEATDDVNPRSIVALRQGRHMLTTFHPELTGDNRFHEYFVRACVLEE